MDPDPGQPNECGSGSTTLLYKAPAEVPEEDADPGPAGVGVCGAGAHRLPVQLGLAAVGLGAHHLSAHQAHRGRARVVP
jgi:hypothetical protein